MTRIFPHRTLISRLLVLVYLLVGSGIGNTLLWCQESEAFSHLEYNLAGKCLDVCLPAEGGRESGEQTTLSPLSWSAADGCLDTQISLSHAPAPGAKDLLADSVTPAWSAFPFFSLRNFPATRLTRLNLVAQPPPPQALAALRTIVLLN